MYTLKRLTTIPARWRWAALAATVLLGGFLLWFFVLRPGGSGGPSVQPQPPPRPGLGKTILYDEYRAAVESALLEVRAAQDEEGDPRKERTEDAIAALEKVEGAQVSGATTSGSAEVDNTLYLDELRRSEPDLEEVEAGLSWLLESIEASGGQAAGTLSGEQAVAALREVLSDPAFDYESRLSPLQRLARWLSGAAGQADPSNTLWRWFSAIVAGLAVAAVTYLASERVKNRWARLGLSALAGLASGGLFFTGLGALDITFSVLGAIGLVVAAVAMAIFFGGLARGAAPSSRPRAVSELAKVLGMGSVEARRRAEEAAAGGDYRGAIRFRCLALLLALDERGKLHFDRAATDREYLFRAPGPLQEELQPLLARFEEVWYGDAPAGPDDWVDYATRADRVEALAGVSAFPEKRAA